MSSTGGDDSIRPIKAVKHFVGARMLKVRHRNTLSGWSAVLSFTCIVGSSYMAYIGWDTCSYYGIFASLIKGYDASFMPWLAGVVGTMMAVIFLSGTLLCTITVTSYIRVRSYHLLNMYMYTLYACLITILLIGSLTALHILLLKNAFKGSLTDSLNRYMNDSSVRLAMDRLQIDLKCCGSSSYTDWWNAEWYPTEYVDRNSPEIQAKMHGNRFLTDDVPFSCCNPEAMRPCVHHAMTETKLHYNYTLDEVTVYTKGCARALHSYFSTTILLHVIASSAWILLALIPLLIVFRYLQTSTVAAIDHGDPYAPARGYLWIRRQLIPPGGHTPDSDDEKTEKSKHTKKKQAKKHKMKNGDVHRAKESSDRRKTKKRSKHSRQRHLSRVDSSGSADTTTAPTQSNTTSIAASSSPIYENSAAYSPYQRPGDTYPQYYKFDRLNSKWNNDDPDARMNTTPSEDIYDTIDPDHQPVTVVPTQPPKRHQISSKNSLDRILDDQIPRSHHKSGHKIQVNPSDDNLRTKTIETRKKNSVQLMTQPSEDIYDQIGPVQSVTAVPVPPPMRNDKQTEQKSMQLIDDDITTVTTAKKADQESIYLEPVNVNTVNDVYQNLPYQSRRTKDTANIDDTYLMPQISSSKAKTSINKNTWRVNSGSVTAAEPVYLVPQVATPESIYMVPSNAGDRNQTDGIYANIDHAATVNKRQNTDESVYLQPKNLTNTMETGVAESAYQPLQPKEAGPRIYEPLSNTSNQQGVHPMQQSTYETLRPIHQQRSSSAHNGANSRDPSAATGVYQKLLISTPHGQDTIARN